MSKHIIKTIIIAALVCSAISCSSFRFGEQNKLVTIAVVNVASIYLQNVIVANPERLNSVAHWNKIYRTGRNEISHEEFAKQLDSIQNRWNTAQHPLYGLEILDIDIDGNEAEVVFKKAAKKKYPKIYLTLEWGGNSWLVVDDSLFGKNKLVAQWQKQPNIFK